MKYVIKGSLQEGYTVNGIKVSNEKAWETAKYDENYETYFDDNGVPIIRAKPNKTLKDNVNNDKQKSK